jgi:hypothetical protein
MESSRIALFPIDGKINSLGTVPQNSRNYNAQSRIAFHPVQNCRQGEAALWRRSCRYNQTISGKDKQ